MFGADRRGSFADARSGECRGRDALAAEDSLIKYARDDGAANWNLALHPRTGAPPNPGWFATTGDASHHAPSVSVAENDDPTRRSDAAPDASITGSVCRPANASTSSAIFWNGWPTPNRRTSRQSARKSIATREASATFTQSALSITCSRKCLNPGPPGTSGSKYSIWSTTTPGTIRPKSRNSTISSSICSPCLEPGGLPGRGQTCLAPESRRLRKRSRLLKPSVDCRSVIGRSRRSRMETWVGQTRALFRRATRAHA